MQSKIDVAKLDKLEGSSFPLITSTECVTYLDQRSKIIIFESILTSFEANIGYDAVGALSSVSRSIKLPKKLA